MSEGSSGNFFEIDEKIENSYNQEVKIENFRP